MTVHNYVADRIDYSRKLLHAGVDSLRPTGGSSANVTPALARSLQASIGAAAMGLGLGYVGCSLLRSQNRRCPKILACGALAFCADFAWRTRGLRADLTHRASKEISKVRDQHWLELHPIDYA